MVLMKQDITILKLAIGCTNISLGVRLTISQVVSVLADDKLLEDISVLISENIYVLKKQISPQLLHKQALRASKGKLQVKISLLTPSKC